MEPNFNTLPIEVIEHILFQVSLSSTLQESIQNIETFAGINRRCYALTHDPLTNNILLSLLEKNDFDTFSTSLQKLPSKPALRWSEKYKKKIENKLINHPSLYDMIPWATLVTLPLLKQPLLTTLYNRTLHQASKTLLMDNENDRNLYHFLSVQAHSIANQWVIPLPYNKFPHLNFFTPSGKSSKSISVTLEPRTTTPFLEEFQKNYTQVFDSIKQGWKKASFSKDSLKNTPENKWYLFKKNTGLDHEVEIIQCIAKKLQIDNALKCKLNQFHLLFPGSHPDKIHLWIKKDEKDKVIKILDLKISA
jgi:hypothetical protein